MKETKQHIKKKNKKYFCTIVLCFYTTGGKPNEYAPNEGILSLDLIYSFNSFIGEILV
jgi:hypothetical protein